MGLCPFQDTKKNELLPCTRSLSGVGVQESGCMMKNEKAFTNISRDLFCEELLETVAFLILFDRSKSSLDVAFGPTPSPFKEAKSVDATSELRALE